MAVSTLLPQECSLHPESDEEESFVVLGHSLPPESNEDTNFEQDLIDASAVQQSLSLTSSALESLSSPSLPKLEADLTPTPQNVSIINTTPNLSVDLSPDEIQQKVDLLIEENLKLKETLHQNNLAMKKQYGILSSWQGEVSQVHASHKQKFDDIKKYVEKLKLENAKLTTIMAAKAEENEQLQHKITQLQGHMETSAKDKVDLNFLKSSFDNLVQFELTAAKKKIQELQEEILSGKEAATELQASCDMKMQVLKDEMENERLKNENIMSDLRKKLKESEALQKILLEEIKSLKAQLLTTSTVKANEGNFEEQLMAAQMHITNLELLRSEDRETINSNEKKISCLENQVKEMTIENDTVAALHAQVEVYKTDFEAERRAKVSLGLEKEQITEDLRHLQRRNQQLLEEVERLRGSDYVYVANEEQAVAPSESPEPVVYTCPMCMIHFRSLRVLQDHIEYCVFHIQ